MKRLLLVLLSIFIFPSRLEANKIPNDVVSSNNEEVTIEIPPGIYTGFEVNKKNVLELSDILTDKLMAPLMQGQVISISVGTPQRLEDFLASKHCIERNKVFSKGLFANECWEGFYGDGNKRDLFVSPVNFKVSDDFLNYVRATLSELSEEKLIASEPYTLKRPFEKTFFSKCHAAGCHKGVTTYPRSLNSRLPSQFEKYYRSRKIDEFAFGLKEDQDYALSLVDRTLDQYELFFFKDVSRQLKNQLGIRSFSWHVMDARRCQHPIFLRRQLEGRDEISICQEELKKFFNPIEMKFVDSNGESLLKRVFEVWEKQPYLKSYNDFCPSAGYIKYRSGFIGAGFYCHPLGKLEYSLMGLGEGIIYSQKQFMMFMKLEQKIMSKTKKIVIQYIPRSRI